jgi:hypothetical protein
MHPRPFVLLLTLPSSAKIIFINPDPDWRKNATLFFRYPQLRTPRYRDLGILSENFIFRTVMAGESLDPVARVFRGEVNQSQQRILDELDEMLADAEQTLWQGNEMRLEIPAFRALIANGRVSIDAVLKLPEVKIARFEEYGLMMLALILSEQKTWQEVLGLSQKRFDLLDWDYIQEKIERNELSQEQVILFPNNIVKRLNGRVVQEELTFGARTFEEIMNFTDEEIGFLERYGVPQDIDGTPECDEWDRSLRLRGW